MQMDEQKYPRIISDRKFDEWIKGCPLQIKEIIIKKNSESSAPVMKIITCPCGDYRVTEFSVETELFSGRRESLGKFVAHDLTSPESAETELPESGAETVYAVSKITKVKYLSGRDEHTWENTDGSAGQKLAPQEIYWQTDPLYEQIKRECAGVTDAKYKPDEQDGCWRCTCGQINLAESEKCGACRVERRWLREHLNPDYLAAHKEIDDKKSEKQIEREIRQRREGISDKAKVILILSGIVLVAVIIVLTFKLFVPSAKYSGAEKALEAGEYDKAISEFSALGSFRDSKDRLYDATYKKAQYITGIDDVYMTTSASEPWYSISEDGVLSFKKDKYTRSWNNFVIPDVVDGIIVRELERNFFLNCKEMTVVTISDCVEILGEQTFYNCEILHTINFGKNVREIGPRAFINCYALETLEIPDTVTSLGLRAFNNCTALQSVVLGKGITEIGSYQFSYCTSLKHITLKSPITAVGEYAFTECPSFEKTFCRFSKSEWTKPEVKEGNEAFESAEISFDN